MQNIIAIDIGNTNTKILINTEELRVISNQAIIEDNFNNLSLNLPQITGEVKLGICSVVNSSISTKIVQKLVKIIAIEKPKIYLLQTHEILALALPSQYQNLKHLGCDRALKIYYLTQLNKFSSSLCFGCGTAFSIEVVVNGKFVDSIITTGLTLQLNSLNAKITNLPIVIGNEIPNILTQQEFYTTQYSIAYGTINTFCSLIDMLAKKWKVTTIVGSGGYADLISKYLLANYQLNSLTHTSLETQVIQEIIANNHLKV